MGFTTPFKSFSDVKSDNPLVQAAVEDQNSGKTAVSWNFTMMPSKSGRTSLVPPSSNTLRVPVTGMPSRPRLLTVGRLSTTHLTEIVLHHELQIAIQ